jgi:acyl-CoA reductase-like NAD-dependent aldehyde dehydrogenase
MEPTPVEPAIAAAQQAARAWARLPLAERCACLRQANAALAGEKEALAQGIALETGKPIAEARGELGAVLAKFDLTIADAEEHLAAREVRDGPHPARVRRLARGPAAVIAPFNFPLHLGNGALLAHLVAGNPVIFKPSPYAAAVAARYAELIAPHFPPGVFQLVQGGAEEAQALCLDARIRAVCFTGSIPAGRQIAKALAEDFSKELALELGGRNAAIICADADLELAAEAVADGLCLTCGQRCNATTRILVDQRVAEDFAGRLIEALARYQPGDPLRDTTRLGPLISAAAVERYAARLAETGDWLLAGKVAGQADGKRGHYVTPAIRQGAARLDVECFVPIADYETFADLEAAIARHNASPFGLTAAVFTREARTFEQFVDELPVGNLYANLPTTFSPSTLPFGGLGLSGNGRPGGRGFVRFCSVEQAIQLGKGTLAG